MRDFRQIVLISLFLLTLFSCRQTKVKSPFIDNIKQGDTLLLFAEFDECGEWGGHKEKIYLTGKENELQATLYVDTVSCEGDPNDTRKKVRETSKTLTTTDRNIIIKYIDKVKIESTKTKFPMCESGNYYKITNKDTTFEFLDCPMNWKEFTIMKDDIFN